MRYRRARIEGASYFFTLVTEERRPIFSEPAAVELFKQAEAQVRSRHPFEIEAEVVLPEHVHMIWALPDGDAAYERRYWEHVIRNDDDFGTHLDYIHYNPVAHGLAKAPRDWPHSTFGRWVEAGTYLPDWGCDEPPELPPSAGKE